jgi:hypothetical protein
MPGNDLNELLARCPGVTILATSRTVLGLRAEEYPVSPLALPSVAASVSFEELRQLRRWRIRGTPAPLPRRGRRRLAPDY